MLKSRIKNVTFFIGVLTMFIGGLIFVIMSDLTFKNTSGNLIISVLLCFGSAIIFFFANNYNERPVVMYIMKAIGLALAIGLIVYFHWFSTSTFYTEAVETLRKGGIRTEIEYAGAKATMPIALAFTYVATVFQATNIVLTATLKDDIAHSEENNAELTQEQPTEETIPAEMQQEQPAEVVTEADAK
ncbi:MAG: hypothetical protein K2M64_00200 [Clostridia bacterium]|nr:hypothetical protein [Clostridia bacterium]